LKKTIRIPISKQDSHRGSLYLNLPWSGSQSSSELNQQLRGWEFVKVISVKIWNPYLNAEKYSNTFICGAKFSWLAKKPESKSKGIENTVFKLVKASWLDTREPKKKAYEAPVMHNKCTIPTIFLLIQ